MAQIPLGNFGNAIAQPRPQVNLVGAAFDNGGAALADLGNAGMQAASNEMQAQRQEAERLAREQKAQDEALGKARATNALLQREMQYKTLEADITNRLATGELRHDQAPEAFKAASQFLDKPDVGNLDPVTRANLDTGYQRIEMQTGFDIGKAAETAKVGELRGETDNALDALGKQVGLPGSDILKINARVAILDPIGQAAYGKAWEKKKQDWLDANWMAHINQQALGVRDSLDGIKALEHAVTSGQYADKLDADKRNTLVARLEGYRSSLLQRQEVAAARSERLAERRMRDAEAEFNTFQALADKGTIIDPAYIDRAAHMTAGTPYQAGVMALAKQAQETGGIAAQPVAVQQATLDQVDRLIAQRGRTPELDKRREQIVKVLNGSQTDLKENGLRAGLERGVITDLSPIDVSTPQGLAASLGKRVDQARTVEMWAGKPVSPLDAREAEQLRGMLDALPPKVKSQAVATIAESVGPRMAGAMALQLDKQDKALALAFASSGAKTTAGRYTSELILKGANALKDGAVMKDDKKVTGWKATIAQQVDGAFPDERAAGAVKDAAYYIAAGFAHENGGSVSGNDIERAVRIAIGGNIIDHNGKKLPIPFTDSADFEAALHSIMPSQITAQAPDGKVRAGGAEISAEEFARSLPGQELIYAGPGRYAVVVRGRPVTNSQGRTIFVKVR